MIHYRFPHDLSKRVKANVMSDGKIKGSHANNGCLGFYEIDVNLPAILFIRIHTPQLCSLIYRF